MYFDFADMRLRCISISASRLYVVSGQDGTPELTTTPVHALILCGLFYGQQLSFYCHFCFMRPIYIKHPLYFRLIICTRSEVCCDKAREILRVSYLELLWRNQSISLLGGTSPRYCHPSPSLAEV